MGVRQLLSDLLPPSPPETSFSAAEEQQQATRLSSAERNESWSSCLQTFAAHQTRRRRLFGSELLIIRQKSSTPNPNSSHSSPNQQSKLICVWSKSPANKRWTVVMEITFIILGSTQELDQERGRRCWSFLCARDLRAPDAAPRWISCGWHEPPAEVTEQNRSPPVY